MRLLGVIVVLSVVSGCTQATPDGPADLGTLAAPSAVTVPLNFQTHLNGAEEVPVRETHAQGQAIFQLEGDELSYKLIAANIENVFQAHIHMGSAGANGAVVVWLYPSTAPAAGPVGGGRHDGILATGTITAANLVGPLLNRPLSELIAAIENGTAYVNVHTSDGVAPANTGPGDFPGGEIRGQL
jgi:hypothetical protein